MSIMDKEQLIDLVIEQILHDIVDSDMQPLEELLKLVPAGNLIKFIREDTNGKSTNYREI